MNNDILIVADVMDGKLATSTAELFSAASALGGSLSAALVSSSGASVVAELIALGASRVYVADRPGLDVAEAKLSALEESCRRADPGIILLPNTYAGRELAARLAARLNTCAVTDCLSISMSETGCIRAVRPAYGGNALAQVEITSSPQVFTIRAKSYPPTMPTTGRVSEIIKIEFDIPAPKTKLLETIPVKQDAKKIEDARLIVAGGRGMGGEAGFKELQELADLLGGVVGASRPPCDQKWISESAQVGITGKIVAPELYIAVAISGSSQHISGCSGAKTVVALNKDAGANIFNIAQLGIVGDWKAVLPPLKAKIKELTSA